MQPKDVERYKKRLLEMHGRSKAEILRMIDVVLDDAAPAGEHDRKVSESSDKEAALENTEESIREAVVGALRRIDEGTYGQCQECGGRIPPARLDAIPFTPYCLDCQRRLEG